MRDVLNCIKKYVEATENEKFIIHWKKLACGLLAGIKDRYKEGYYEPDIVKLIESIINNIGQFETQNRKLNIETRSIFIHGNKSRVEFEFYGKKTQRELGDIIFILSIVYNGKKYFEKMTINQVKKSNKASWNLSNDSAKEQLYLLSRFPTFRGTNNSLIPMKDYNLPNYSRCLGTHGLLYYPGDFALISSNVLETILPNRKQLKLGDLLLYSKKENCSNYYPYIFPCDIFDFPEYYSHLLYKLIHSLTPHWHFRFCPLVCKLPILGNSCIAYNSYEFSDKYLRGHIGEMIYARKLPYNRFASQFLQDLLMAIERKAETEKNDRILNFVKSFNQHRYGEGQGGEDFREFDHEGGGIGIIHTFINLEGE